MSEHLYYFRSAQGESAVVLPFDLDATLAAWEALRRKMIRRVGPAFTREEWAYLITFLDTHSLLRPFTQTFGERATAPLSRVARFSRPRGPIAIWLPNNVSLLGPLTLILLSLTGNPIRVKGGSTSEDLTSAFLAYVREHDTTGLLKDAIGHGVRHEVFGRDDPRNAQMAAEAGMRVVFGSDAAAKAIHGLPHPLGSVGFSHSDRRSEAWVEAAAVDDTLLGTLIKVFAIYGQAGCTSPGRVVLLDHTREQALAVRNRMLALWPSAGLRDVAPHHASQNIMLRQWAAGTGWDAVLAPRNQAVLAVGDSTLPSVPGHLLLPLVVASEREAVATMPANIQTLGHGVSNPYADRWLRLLAATRVKRFVPIRQMHHFGPLWDGEAFWMQAFEHVQVEGDS